MTLNETIDTVQSSMRDNGASSELIAKTVNDLRKAAEQAKAAREPVVKTKMQLQIIINDPEGLIPEGAELTAFALQVEEEAHSTAALDRVKAAAAAFNNSRAGMSKPVKSVAETFEVVKARYWKQDLRADQKAAVKTKAPAYCIVTSGSLS